MDKIMTGRWILILWIMQFTGWNIGSKPMMCRAATVLVGGKDTSGYGVYSAVSSSNPVNLMLNFTKLIDLNGPPRGITHDPSTTDLYIAEADDNGSRIKKSDSNGASVVTAVQFDEELVPTGIHISNVGDARLLWAHNLDGPNTATVSASYLSAKWGVVFDSDESLIYTAGRDGIREFSMNENKATNLGISEHEYNYTCLAIDETERTLYAGGNSLSDSIIVKHGLTQKKTDVYNVSVNDIRGVTTLDDNILFVDSNDGLKVISKCGGDLLPVTATGLDCHEYYSIHVIDGNTIIPTECPIVTTSTTDVPIGTTSTTDVPLTTQPNVYQQAVQDIENTVGSNDGKAILSKFEHMTTIFPDHPDLQDDKTTKISSNVDVYVVKLHDDHKSTNSWDVELTRASDDVDYDFKISFPENAWEKTKGRVFVASVLTSDLQSYTVNSESATFSVGSHILSINMFNSNEDRAMYTTKKTFNITLSILPGALGEPTCQFITSIVTWSPKGCFMSGSNASHVTCSCNHLTSFAVLMQVTEVEISDAHLKTQLVLTYIILPISILCLAATIILYIYCKVYKKLRIIIHINLAASLLIAQLLFLTGINAKPEGACIFVTFALHFFWLVVYMWMLVEGVQLFLKVNPHINLRIKLPICTPLAWGLPAVIAIITLGVGKFKYPADDPDNKVCWLPSKNGMIAAFAGPALLITAVNFVVLTIIIHKFLNLKTNKDKSQLDRMKAGIRAALILIPLLGLTCIFGVLQIGQAATVFGYLFIISFGLQGVFIFITQCLLDDDVITFLKQKAHDRVKRAGQSESSIHTNTTVSTVQ